MNFHHGLLKCLMIIKKQNVKFVERALSCLSWGEGLYTYLLRECNKALKDLCEDKLAQMSMDGLRVNLKLLKKVHEELTSNEFH